MEPSCILGSYTAGKSDMFGIVPFQFRFRGKARMILDIYYCFLDHEGQAMHPTQIAKHTGISFAEVARRLDATPELFVRLPSRKADVTRYRITTSAATRSVDETEALIHKYAGRESLLLNLFIGMLATMLLILILIIAPNL